MKQSVYRFKVVSLWPVNGIIFQEKYLQILFIWFFGNVTKMIFWGKTYDVFPYDSQRSHPSMNWIGLLDEWDWKISCTSLYREMQLVLYVVMCYASFILIEVLWIGDCEEQKEYVMYFIGFAKYMVTVGDFTSSKEERSCRIPLPLSTPI